MSDYQSKIREHIASELGIDLSSVSDSDPLFTSGLIDSFALIELLAFLEQELGADIDIADIDIDKIDTIEAIAKLAS
ncbi:acyl carrier protein [Gynuella sunshinyii]|uniref:Acyl carrier protein n=1 Tax=Gynuella sunshinyii YC6258 TaxID=1445510 RepID=A0A0C5VU04_9GAMM|nr:acyl carrier protein [Gynuella sunshinyii]AJQ93844.1 acyl carrier protein [Gynuella sunshinyii YC6258]